MKHTLLACTLLLGSACATAQVTLVPVKRFYKEIPGVKVLGTYQPAGTFAREFPNFMKDGRYRLDYTYPKWNADNTSYTSDKTPAVFVTSNGNRENFDLAVATFTSYNNVYNPCHGASGGDGWSDGFAATARQHYRQHTAGDKHEKLLIEGYDKQMQFFSHATDSALKARGIVHTAFADVSFNDYRNIHVTPGTILLYFRQEKALILSHNMTDDYPEYMTYSLTVRNAFGEIYKTYSQLVLIDAEESKYAANNYSHWVSYGFFMASYEGAVQSLVNQFMNDRTTVNAIKNDIQAVKQKIAADPAYARLADAKIKYAAMKAYLSDIAAISLSVTGSYSRYSSGITANNTYAGYVSNSSISAEANNAFAAAGTAATGLIGLAFSQSEANENNRQQAELNREGGEYDHQMEELANEIAALPPSADKDALVQQIRQDRTDLNNSLDGALAAQKEAAKATVVSRQRATDGMQQLNSAMQQLSNSLHAESAAVTNGGNDPNSPAAKQCAQEATQIWQSDPRTKNAQNSQLQSDLDDNKALMIEIMIDHCGQYMTAQETATYKQMAQQAKDEANQLRGGNTFKYQK